jgi:hypothetical protein
MTPLQGQKAFKMERTLSHPFISNLTPASYKLICMKIKKKPWIKSRHRGKVNIRYRVGKEWKHKEKCLWREKRERIYHKLTHICMMIMMNLQPGLASQQFVLKTTFN